MRLAVIFHRLGPYHVARLRAAAAAGRGEVIAVELSGAGGDYAWSPVAADGFTRVVVRSEGDSNDLPRRELARRVHATLDAVAPNALAIAGWGDRGMRSATRWGLRRRLPMVLMADSQYHDERRVWWKEWIKRRLVACFGAALVAGTTHADYLVRLGMARERIVTGYDVVDNDHFARGADAARAAAPRLRAELGLPDRYFLSCARFVPKKNLALLLDAFAAYRSRAGADAWHLVLVGDGPLRPALAAHITRLGLTGCVHLPGFQQYAALPTYYGLAAAFVLPSLQEQWGLVVNEAMAAGLPVLVSRVAGCAPDLVRGGVTGFTFDPTAAAELTDLLTTLATDPDGAASRGAAARQAIAAWSPARFAEGLWAATSATRAILSCEKSA